MKHQGKHGSTVTTTALKYLKNFFKLKSSILTDHNNKRNLQ